MLHVFRVDVFHLCGKLQLKTYLADAVDLLCVSNAWFCLRPNNTRISINLAGFIFLRGFLQVFLSEFFTSCEKIKIISISIRHFGYMFKNISSSDFQFIFDSF